MESAVQKKRRLWRRHAWSTGVFKKTVLVMGVAVLVFFAVYVFTPSAAGKLISLILGINVNQLSPQSAERLQYLKSEVVRMDSFPWDIIEAKKGTYDFTVPDKAMKWARDGKLNVLGILQYAPNWANGQNFKTPSNISVSACGIPDLKKTESVYNRLRTYPPEQYADFGKFAYAIAKRYPDVTYWQIWNEPNNPIFWPSGPDADEYANLLKTAYSNIKKSNPKAKVILGGISLNDLEYINALYTAGAKNYFDILAVHLFNPGQPPSSYLANELEKLRATMKKNKDSNKNIWLTEIGWYTGTAINGVSDQLQGRYLEQAFRIAKSKSYVGAIFWNSFMNCDSEYDAANPEHNWGIYNSNLEPKEAVSVMRGTIIRKQNK